MACVSSVPSGKRQREEELLSSPCKTAKISQNYFSIFMYERFGSSRLAIDLFGKILSYVIDPANPSFLLSHLITIFEQEEAALFPDNTFLRAKPPITPRDFLFRALQRAYVEQTTIGYGEALREMKQIERRFPDKGKLRPSIVTTSSLRCSAQPYDPFFAQLLHQKTSFPLRKLTLNAEWHFNEGSVRARPRLAFHALRTIAEKCPSLTSLALFNACLDDSDERSAPFVFPCEALKFDSCNMVHIEVFREAFQRIKCLDLCQCAVRREGFLALLQGKQKLESFFFYSISQDFREEEIDPAPALFTPIDDALIEHMVEQCPHLKTIYIEFPIEGEVTEKAFHALKYLSDLESLTLLLRDPSSISLRALLPLEQCQRLSVLQLNVLLNRRLSKKENAALRRLVARLPSLRTLYLGAELPSELARQLLQTRPTLTLLPCPNIQELKPPNERYEEFANPP